jgi:rare lipoprotein A
VRRSRRLRFALALAPLLVFGACSHAPRPVAAPDLGVGRPGGPPAPTAVAPDAERGVASYYAGRFEGRRTASGERYHGAALTAAHRTLPFGTRVRVTNLENGRSVEVVINDRGPHRSGRIIDLSRAAAEALDFVRAGTARVAVEVVDLAEGDLR